MKKTTTLFQCLLGAFLCFTFLFQSSTLLAQEDGPLLDDYEPILAQRKRLVKCDRTVSVSLTIKAFCSHAGISVDSAKVEYDGHVLKAVKTKIACDVDCDEGETCEEYVSSWAPNYTPPTPQTGVSGCAGYYFKKKTVRLIAGCTTCHNPFQGEEEDPWFLQETGEDGENKALVETLEVYPNPASDFVDMQIRVREDLNNPMVVIYDLAGKAVISEQLDNLGIGYFNLQLNVASLEAGVYFVAVQNSHEQLETTKLIINR